MRGTGRRGELALEDLYRELAAHRARDARTALAGEPDRSGSSRRARPRSRRQPGSFTTPPLPASAQTRPLDEHAAGPEAAAARFELAADIARARRAR